MTTHTKAALLIDRLLESDDYETGVKAGKADAWGEKSYSNPAGKSKEYRAGYKAGYTEGSEDVAEEND